MRQLAQTPRRSCERSQGGTLIQHLNSPNRHQRTDASRELPVHPVTIEPDTLLSAIAGTDTWQVNSRHHRAVRTIAGSDPEDRTVEALEHPDRDSYLRCSGIRRIRRALIQANSTSSGALARR
jgi:hypothetical protein